MIALESMAVDMPVVEGHPNRAGFRGVLTVVDVASQRAPSGSKGHKVLLTRKAAEEALPSLLGMALDYAPTYDRHDVRRKVGVITSAEIVGRNLEVGGYLYAKDFPDVVEEIGKSGLQASGIGRHPLDFESRNSGVRAQKSGFPLLAKAARSGASDSWGNNKGIRRELAGAVERLREITAGMMGRKLSGLRAGGGSDAGSATGLGMSFEVAHVTLADVRSKVWILTKVTFTGAAILRRNRAAYEETWIGLSPES